MEIHSMQNRVEDAAQKARGFLRSRYGIWLLGLISFAESALPVPLVTDPFLAAYVFANRAAAVRGLVVTIFASVIGGLFTYGLSFWLAELLTTQYLSGALRAEFLLIAEKFNQGTLIMTLLGAITPVPYTVVAMAAGFTGANIFLFVVGTVIGRLFRYGLLTWLTYRFGTQALAMARKQLLIATIVCFVLAGVFVYLKLYL